MRRIFIVTGEASGDLHGANLAKALFALRPSLSLIGVGGSKMAEAGVQLLPGIDRVDAIGVPGFAQLWRGVRTLSRLKRFLRMTPLDAVVFIDSPGMNLRLAKTAAKMGHRVVYYIAPQVWAWGARRLEVIRRTVDRLLVILPFEESYFRAAGIPCEFVGHPLLDVIAPSYHKPALRAQFGLSPHGFVLGLLPGSRVHEVEQFLPVMLDAVKRVHDHEPFECLLARAESIPAQLVERIVIQSGLKVKVVANQANEVMAASDLLVTASGTATLQAAIIGTPMMIVYRVSWVTYRVAKLLVRIPYIGLVNIVAGRFVAPELIQDQMTAERLAGEIRQLRENPQRLEAMRADFQHIRQALGGPGASKRAAERVLAEAMR
ncbi:MAG: lipid-A-disaccharide synthase [Nitrospirae bacterium]|nr:MAG: lipid-A-disaccharide synthase [Nitrospirota bacterium]